MNSTQAVERFVPDAPVACVLSKVSSTPGLGLVRAVSLCGTSGAAPAVVECASPGEIAGVTPDKDTPTPCGSAPALEADSPISGDDDASSSDEDASASADDAPAVVDDFSSSRTLFA